MGSETGSVKYSPTPVRHGESFRLLLAEVLADGRSINQGATHLDYPRSAADFPAGEKRPEIKLPS